MAQLLSVGLVGCGAISGAYLSYARNFSNLRVTACADLVRSAAGKKAAEFGIGRVMEVDQLLSDPSIDVVLNLTVPKAHANVTLAALAAGKHVYCEKPLGISRVEGQQIVEAARRANRKVGVAPDTFLGAGLQTARKAIDDGLIGTPTAFTSFMMSPGHESWHPSPEFFYAPGGGPMLDMGPYHITALLNLLGPVREISGATSIAIPQRTITSQPKAGKVVEVEINDHVTGLMRFENGAVGTIIMSFATHHSHLAGEQPITIFGTEGTLRVPDPNHFDGPVHVRRRDDADWQPVPHAFATGYGRAIGLADLCDSIVKERPARAGLDQGFAVLDLMLGFTDSSNSGRVYRPSVKYERPKLLTADERF